MSEKSFTKTEVDSVKPSRKQRAGQHFRRFWWLYLLSIVVVVLVVVLPVIFVAIPRTAQRYVNQATLHLKSQNVSDPLPDRIGNLSIAVVAESNAPFHPTIEAFDGQLYALHAPDKPFGTLHVPSSKVSSSTEISDDQTLIISDMEQFIDYNTGILMNETFSFGLSGKPQLKLNGLKSFSVDFDQTVTSKGLNGFKGFEIQDYAISIKGFPDGNNLHGVAYVHNPTVMTLEFGNVTFDLHTVNNTFIGQAFINNFVLRPGDNYTPTQAKTNQTVVLGLLAATDSMVLPVNITGNKVVNSETGDLLEYYTKPLQSLTLSTTLNVTEGVGRAAAMM